MQKISRKPTVKKSSKVSLKKGSSLPNSPSRRNGVSMRGSVKGTDKPELHEHNENIAPEIRQKLVESLQEQEQERLERRRLACSAKPVKSTFRKTRNRLASASAVG